MDRDPYPDAASVIVSRAASAGSLHALSHLLVALPNDFPAPPVVVQQLDRRHRSLRGKILDKRASLAIEHRVFSKVPKNTPRDRMVICPNH